MGTVTGQCVGIDISEDFLDVYLHPAGKEVRLPHNDEGTATLVALLREQSIERVVLESTGGLQRRLVLMNTLVARGQLWDPSHAT
jgi:transposase